MIDSTACNASFSKIAQSVLGTPGDIEAGQPRNKCIKLRNSISTLAFFQNMLDEFAERPICALVHYMHRFPFSVEQAFVAQAVNIINC